MKDPESTRAPRAALVDDPRRLEALATNKLALNFGRDSLRTLRVSKMDKECVVIVALAKSGSTLLAYICALLNTRNEINKFRNDFDISPILSGNTQVFPQNFNARQDGKYQMYKVNARLLDLDESLRKAGIQKTVWMCRDFEGYYSSYYWWLVQEYLPRADAKNQEYRSLDWDTYKRLTLEISARHHIEELWYAYGRAKDASTDALPKTLFLTYEGVTREKRAALKKLAAWLEIDADAEMLQGIENKTSKEAMAVGDRFDVLHFGDGGGLSKVNLTPHKGGLDAAEKSKYAALFQEQFAPAGIGSYAELVAWFADRQASSS